MMIHKKILKLLILALLAGNIYASPVFNAPAMLRRTPAGDSIKSNIIWSDCFEQNTLSNWQIHDEDPEESSDWHIEKGYLVQTTETGDSKKLIGTNIVSGNVDWKNYVVKSDLIYTDDDYVGVLFRYQNEANYYRFIFSFKFKTIRLDKKVSDKVSEIKILENQPLDTCKYSIVISAQDDLIKIYLNEKLVIEAKDNQLKNGKIGFTSLGSLASFFDDVFVYSNYKIDSSIQPDKIVRGPYIQSVLADSAIIRWNTNFSCISKVEYGLKPEPQFSIITPNSKNNHEVTLKNLSGGTKYYYRVFYGDKSTEWYSFKTAPANNVPFNIIIYSDNQLNFLRHKEIVNNFSKRDYDFIIDCGDVVQRGLRKDWDTEFFEPLSSVISQKSLFSVPGNHELNSKYFYQNFSYPNSQHENYYSFKYSNCFFIFMDNPFSAYPENKEYTDYKIGSPQYIWLEEQLDSKEAQSADWLFVISHVPIAIPGIPGAYPDSEQQIVPLFQKYGVDFSFSGHLHGYKRGEEGGVNYFITGGGGGALFKRNKESARKQNSFLRIFNYCYLSIDDKKISFKAFDIDNKLFDEAVFIK
jgi:hypothetical protein